MKNIKIKQIAIGVALLVIGILLGRGLFSSPSGPVPHQDHVHETKAEVWTCSMHPQIRENGPGKCPLCGMDLIPVSSGNDDDVGINQVQMTEAAVKLANVRTVIVGKSIPEKQVYLPGRIEADERNIATVTAHFNGRVEKLFADYTGQYIKRGQPLATLYSPDLVTAQKELFEALKFKSTNPSFYEAAIQKLKLLELTDGQIQAIVARGEPQYNFNVFAHRSGTILTRKISEGEHVMNGQVLFEIANLNRLWVLFDAYESDLPWIKVGDSISFKVNSLPGKDFHSVVSFIDPLVNNQTRTASVRTEIENTDNQLKPEMFVEGIINAGLTASNETIIIPKTAVLWTGKRAVVYVKQLEFEKPTFQFREIQLGTDAGEYYVVTEGLMAGEEVVANGVFKIDGAAQLQGKISMMNPEGGRVTASHRHQDRGILESTDPKRFQVPDDFRNQLKEIFSAYLPLKDGLINSDAQTVKKEAGKLLSVISKVDMSLVKDEAHQEWMKDLRVLSSSVNSIIGAPEVEDMRKVLPVLSDQLYQSVSKFQVETGGYRMFCPMAFGSHGAYWLSDSNEVLNPYLGSEMLTCGRVEEKLK